MKIIFSVFLALSTIHSIAQDNKNQSDYKAIQNISSAEYRLYPTQNIWTFIKLDTRTGQMWQVQFGLKAENRVESILSLMTLVTKDGEVNNRFTLYPTQNIYNFILLDQVDGRTWQVQWSTDPQSRVIIQIE